MFDREITHANILNYKKWQRNRSLPLFGIFIIIFADVWILILQNLIFILNYRYFYSYHTLNFIPIDKKIFKKNNFILFDIKSTHLSILNYKKMVKRQMSASIWNLLHYLRMCMDMNPEKLNFYFKPTFYTYHT